MLDTRGLVLFSLDAAEYPHATRNIAAWVLGIARRARHLSPTATIDSPRAMLLVDEVGALGHQAGHLRGRVGAAGYRTGRLATAGLRAARLTPADLGPTSWWPFRVTAEVPMTEVQRLLDHGQRDAAARASEACKQMPPPVPPSVAFLTNPAGLSDARLEELADLATEEARALDIPRA